MISLMSFNNLNWKFVLFEIGVVKQIFMANDVHEYYNIFMNEWLQIINLMEYYETP